MGRAYYKVLFAMYIFAVAVCGSLRSILLLWHTDPATGLFATDGWMVTAYNLILAIFLIVMFILNRLRRSWNDYPVGLSLRPADALSILLGLSVLAFTWLELSRGNPDTAEIRSETWNQVLLYLNLGFGSLTGLSFILNGVRGFMAKSRLGALLAIFPAIWQIIVLLGRFNSYILTISGNLLAVLFMLFVTMFYMGHARVVCGLGRRDGRNYLIPLGLGASLCGMVLVVPNTVFRLLNPGMILPGTPDLYQTIYIFLSSLYALVFTVSFTRSIRTV